MTHAEKLIQRVEGWAHSLSLRPLRADEAEEAVNDLLALASAYRVAVAEATEAVA
jgi:hypothetical protein